MTARLATRGDLDDWRRELSGRGRRGTSASLHLLEHAVVMPMQESAHIRRDDFAIAF